jgi:hypothetical protein
MIRTLTFVALLALLAGGSLGFFVAEARDRPVAGTASPVDPVLERKVSLYAQYYDLSPAESAEVRAALMDYDQKLTDLLRRLRTTHSDEFKTLADQADGRIRTVIAAHR